VIIHALRNNPYEIDIMGAGTAMRFMTALMATREGEEHVLTGTERMKHRPIHVLVNALRRLGADIEYAGEEGFPPLRIKGRKLEGGQLEVPGNISSQFISALLLIGPTLRNGLTLRLTGDIISRPYIDLTLWMMREFGADADWSDFETITVAAKSYEERPYYIESDWSAASYWYEMMALSRQKDDEIQLQGLMDGSKQGDSSVRYIFSLLGVKTTFKTTEAGVPTTVTLRHSGHCVPRLEYDFVNSPDLAQTFVVCCAGMGIPFHFKGLSTLKVKVASHLHQASAITLYAETTEVYEGEQIALDYEIEPEATTYRTLEWTSSDQSVATVDSKGVVTGVSTGGSSVTKTVTITGKAMDGSGVSASIDITVKRIVQPQSITLDQTFSADNGYAFALNEQGTTLTYTTVPAESTQSLIEWTSSDETIATVEAGYVKFVGFGEVTITATCPETGNASSVKLNIPVGLLRETFHNSTHYSVYNASQSGNGTSTSHEWHDGYITITTYTANATTQRADIKWWDTPATLHAGNYPIIAIKVDDVKDLYKADGVTARNLNFDVVGKSESGADFKALGNGNNKYTGDLKCSDGSHVFIYDLSTLAFGTGGVAPTNESIKFNTFQLKYADIKTIDHQITYDLYWFQTFKTVDDVKKYVTDVDGLTFEVIK